MLTSRYPSGRCISTAVGPGRHAQHIYVCIVPDARCKAHGTSLNYISPAAAEKKGKGQIFAMLVDSSVLANGPVLSFIKTGNFNILMVDICVLIVFSYIGVYIGVGLKALARSHFVIEFRTSLF